MEPDFADGTDSLLGVIIDEPGLDWKGPKPPPSEADSSHTSEFLDLLQAQTQRDSFAVDVVGGPRSMDCETLRTAEQKQEEHMRLLLAVRTLSPTRTPSRMIEPVSVAGDPRCQQ